MSAMDGQVPLKRASRNLWKPAHPRGQFSQGDLAEFCSTAGAPERQFEDRRNASAASPQRKRLRPRSLRTPTSIHRSPASDHSVSCSPTCAQRMACSAKDRPNAALERSQESSRGQHHLPSALVSRRCEPRGPNAHRSEASDAIGFLLIVARTPLLRSSTAHALRRSRRSGYKC